HRIYVTIFVAFSRRAETALVFGLQGGSGFSSGFCSAAPPSDRALYEFRVYDVQPHLYTPFLQLTNQKIHLRTAHSQLIGYWSVEYGALNQVFHIWKYDSYSARSAVRSSLAQDPDWLQQYISKAIPMLSKQTNEVARLLPWQPLRAPPTEGGVVELQRFHIRPGGGACRTTSAPRMHRGKCWELSPTTSERTASVRTLSTFNFTLLYFTLLYLTPHR
uniref:NIPSNAP domain-containing protein n=1 Tax=Neogobius melanostomus TaxID=47308 RepID=A0A8C6WEJ4_9GOBI